MAETVGFEVWKARLAARDEDIGRLGIAELALIDGLAYGQVHVDGWLHARDRSVRSALARFSCAHFFVDESSCCATTTMTETVPQTAIFHQRDAVQAGGTFNFLEVYIADRQQLVPAAMDEVAAITITPYPEGCAAGPQDFRRELAEAYGLSARLQSIVRSYVP